MCSIVAVLLTNSDSGFGEINDEAQIAFWTGILGILGILF